MATHCEDSGIVFQDDTEAVSFVAGLFNISEFRLFEIAYANWFDSEATQKDMDRFFGSYIKSGLIPFWLRNMVRRVICKHRKGDLTPGEFGIKQPSRSRFEWGIGWFFGRPS